MRVVAGAVALMLVVAGCRAESAPGTDTQEGVGVDEVEGESAAGSVPADPVDNVVRGDILHADGWGPLTIGMTRAQVVAAAGEDANPGAVGGPDPESCDQFRPIDAPAGMLVMIERGRLTRITVSRNAAVKTDRGFGVGSAAADILAAYGASAEVTPHEYQAAPAAYITVWSTAPSPSIPDDARARGIVYETDAAARVIHVHVGGPSIRYVEGCL